MTLGSAPSAVSILAGMVIVTALIVGSFLPIFAPADCAVFKFVLLGICWYCTMTVTVLFEPTADPRSLENFAVEPAYDGIAESTSSTSPTTRPQAALNSRELGGRPSRPHVICDLSLLIISVMAAFLRDMAYTTSFAPGL